MTTKERPIIFNGPMVRALLDGRKTQTRRIVKPQPDEDSLSRVIATGEWHDTSERVYRCPYGQPGDRLVPAMQIPSVGKRYCADLYGKIWSRAQSGSDWRILRNTLNSKGYLTVTPAIAGKYPTRLVHRLVAEAFYGAPQGRQEVRHLDADRTNNAPENLAWGSAQENWSDRSSAGSGVREQHHSAKLTLEQVAEIRLSAESQRALARRFGVSQSTISAARNGATWAPLPAAADVAPRWASRITLEITDVRVQRLQEISEEDALAEGIEYAPSYAVRAMAHLGLDDGDWIPNAPPISSFQALWQSIHGPGSWDANPWVWAISFCRVKS